MVEMQAAQLRRFGGPEVLEVGAVLRPEPGPGQVLVRVAASGVNPHDAFVRQGTLKWQTGRKFPLGVGLDFAGEVVSAGTQVDQSVVGDRVWGMVAPPKGHRTAAAAEFVAVPADRVAPFPQRLSMVEAASLVTSATTAVHALCEVAGTQAGARVLVRGAAGGVGTVAVQLARALGAHVTASASARDAEFVARSGADEVLDYRTALARDLGPFDVIIDTAGAGMLAFRRRLARGGRMVAINFGSGHALAAIGASTVFGAKRIRTFAAYPDAALLERTAEYVRTGAINPAVAMVYPLADIVDAHRALASSHRPGRLVLKVTR